MIKFCILNEVIFYQEFGFDTIPSIFQSSIGGVEYRYKVFCLPVLVIMSTLMKLN